jgi:hypothetical protein
MYFFHQGIHRLLHGGFGQIQHRLAVGFLIAGIGECVERQGILIGGGDFLLDQTADDAGFIRGKFNIHFAASKSAPVVLG